ncbi:MAG TPA: hypothetical protein VFR58_17565 [Flavisolibacter sp.]|nr:hypothetical protein [Flavisolibacter sp.]
MVYRPLYSNPNGKVAGVGGATGGKIGPSMVVKVTAGNGLHVRVSSWYKLNGTAPQSPGSALAELIYALTGNVAGVMGGKASAADLINSSWAGQRLMAL